MKYDCWIDYSFTVYRPSELKAALNAGAGICNGRKCRDCGYKCYNKGHEGANIAEKLRG